MPSVTFRSAHIGSVGPACANHFTSRGSRASQVRRLSRDGQKIYWVLIVQLAPLDPGGQLVQWQNAPFTSERSLVRFQHCPLKRSNGVKYSGRRRRQAQGFPCLSELNEATNSNPPKPPASRRRWTIPCARMVY